MATNLCLVAVGYYGAAIVSAVAPWVNAEVLMLSAIPYAGSSRALVILVLAVSAGQMTGKAVTYWIARRSTRTRTPRVQAALDRWEARMRHRPRAALAITFASALVGIPPFFIVSMAAGALQVAFGRFLAVGAAGRLLHFAVVAFLPLAFRT